MKKRLREFVKTSWKPTHDQDDNSFNAEARILALNFFDFLTESRGNDTNSLPTFLQISPQYRSAVSNTFGHAIFLRNMSCMELHIRY